MPHEVTQRRNVSTYLEFFEFAGPEGGGLVVAVVVPKGTQIEDIKVQQFSDLVDADKLKLRLPSVLASENTMPQLLPYIHHKDPLMKILMKGMVKYNGMNADDDQLKAPTTEMLIKLSMKVDDNVVPYTVLATNNQHVEIPGMWMSESEDVVFMNFQGLNSKAGKVNSVSPVPFRTGNVTQSFPTGGGMGSGSALLDRLNGPSCQEGGHFCGR